MNRIVVRGGRRLSGEVVIGGSKNAALPVLFGGIVTDGVCTFSNLPRVSDVLQTLEILRYLGARIRFLSNGDVRVDYTGVQSKRVPASLTTPIRGSTYLLGAMLSRFGQATLAGAGGCNFGSRPIDQHLFGFSCLGAQVEEGRDGVSVNAPLGLWGREIRLAMPSVGATANLMLAASRASGETVLHNAAAEPHVAALASFLTDAGANIQGVGSDTIRIVGVKRLHGTAHTVIPDMIEAGTYLCIGAACGGPVRVRSVCPSHLGCLLQTFSEMGITVDSGTDHITVAAPRSYRNTQITTGPYPSFPTDLHPQMTALFALGGRALGEGVVNEAVFASRFRYIEELRRMGADITIEGRRAQITPRTLHAARLHSPDLRGGAALLLAALATEGISEIRGADTIGRGYEHPETKLRGIGAQIRVL